MLRSLADIDDLARYTKHFWEGVDRSLPDGCWPWTGYVLDSGYGQIGIKINGRQGHVRVHRLAYLLTHDTLPVWPRMVLHLCGNKLCCRPEYLKDGTHQENMTYGLQHGEFPRGDKHWSRFHPARLARAERSGSYLHPERLARGERHNSRTRPETVLRGEHHGRAKLTADMVMAARVRVEAGEEIKTIAVEYGVDPSTLRQAVLGVTWAHLDMPARRRADYIRRGEALPAAKASVEVVQQIRALAAQGVPRGELARRFGLSESGTRAIIQRKTWKQVP